MRLSSGNVSVLLLFLLVFLTPIYLFSNTQPDCSGSKPGEGLSLAAVQLEIHFSDYSSSEVFWTKIDRILGKIIDEVKPDLIVFPEYTGVFYTLIPYTEGIADYSDLESAAGNLGEELGGISVPEELFYLGKSRTDEYIEGWAERSVRYSVSILAGTVFYPVDGPERELRNRALVFNERGDLFYTQDKVYLTDFERDICRISPGNLSDARGFSLGNSRIYLTICRDTYFESWEERFSEPGLLWIDIKANGEIFDREQQVSFSRALPARLPDVPVKYGLTVCLVGDYLDLLWEGESSLIEQSREKEKVLVSGESWNGEEILLIELKEY